MSDNLEWQWGIEQNNRASSADLRRWINWQDSEKHARASMSVIEAMGKNPQLVRRLVGPIERIENDNE